MRKYLLLAAVAMFVSAAYSQFNLQYNFSLPRGEQGKHINQVHGLIIGFDIPLKNSPFSIGPELGFGMYGLKSVRMDLPFQNGYLTQAKVNYSTSLHSYAALVRFQPVKLKPINPYFAFRGGVIQYHSNMRIDDPEDPLGCRPLEERVLLNDATWTASAGAGMRINLRSSRDLYLDFGGFYTIAGRAEYLKITDEHHASDPKARIYSVKFEHIPSGEVHEHAVGTIYNTVGRMIEFRLGVSYLLGNQKKQAGANRKSAREGDREKKSSCH